MRVLAHPTRLRLLTELRLHGPLTVGALGDLVDEAPGTVSYHLGRLAEHDLVVEAPELAKDRRERWWRSAHRTTSWDPNQGRTDPELRMASDALRRQVFRSYAESLEHYLQIEPVLDPAWTQGGRRHGEGPRMSVATKAAIVHAPSARMSWFCRRVGSSFLCVRE